MVKLYIRPFCFFSIAQNKSKKKLCSEYFKDNTANHLILCTYSGTQYQLLAITDVVNINDNEESILDDDVYSSIMMMMLSMMM